MSATPQTQRDLFEAAVIERMKESGFLEVEIRVECLARCDDGYQDEVINAGWHYWNAALAAGSGDDEQPRYTTRRLHEEIRKAEERGRQEERECTTSPSDYYKRAAAILEKLRDEIGSGFGEGDIELIGDVVIARLKAWDKLDREDVKRRLSAPPAPSAAEPQCCMCGKKGLSTAEGDGGTECELSDGRWVCSGDCWDRAVSALAAPAKQEV